MRPILLQSLIRLAVFGAVAIFFTGNSQSQPGPLRPAIDPFADGLLRKMSDKLVAAKQISLIGKRTMDEAMAQGRALNRSVMCELSLRRPNHLMVKIEGNGAIRNFYYDGTQATLLDKTLNAYATVNIAGNIDQMLDAIQAKYGFKPPLADFLVQDPYTSLTRDILTGKVTARETIDRKVCHHLSFTAKEVDWELWVGVEDLLPYKYELVQKKLPGRPRLASTFLKWNLDLELLDKTFAFKAPAGAEKIEIREQQSMRVESRQDPAPGGFEYRDMLFSLPGDAVEVSRNGARYYKLGARYYRPAFYQGETVYVKTEVE